MSSRVSNSAEARGHQVGCWRPKPLKQKFRRHRIASGEKVVGWEEAAKPQKALQRTTVQATSLPPSGWEVSGPHRLAVHWRPSRGKHVLCFSGNTYFQSWKLVWQNKEGSSNATNKTKSTTMKWTMCYSISIKYASQQLACLILWHQCNFQ